jgi:hypothetical protein
MASGVLTLAKFDLAGGFGGDRTAFRFNRSERPEANDLQRSVYSLAASQLTQLQISLLLRKGIH